MGFGFETPIGAAAAVEVDGAAPSLEQLGVEMPLQGADTVAGGGGDTELLAGRHEAPVARGGLEEAKAVERREGAHDSGRREPWGWGEINKFFASSQIHLSPKTSRGSRAGVPMGPCEGASRGFRAKER